MTKMRWPAVTMISAAALFLFCSCSYKPMPPKPHQPGDYAEFMTFKTGVHTRAYKLHIPPDYAPDQCLPLVVVLHGAFSNAKEISRDTGLNRLADRERFFVLYPEGIGLLGFLQHWNAEHCCGKAQRDGIDDAAFINSAMDDVCARINIDPDRIYIIGYSNGGMMAYSFAAKYGDKLAAAAVVAGTIGSRPNDRAPMKTIAAPKTAVPIMIIHGVNDAYIPYEGGAATGRKRPESFLSVEDCAQFWSSKYLGVRQAESVDYQGTVHRHVWIDQKQRPVVEVWTLSGWGHDWPGPAKYTEKRRLPNFDSAEVIWEFFKKHEKNHD